MKNGKDKSSAMKNKILAASISLFSQNGFDGASVSEIAKLAGVNKALIYYYFKNKNDILESLFDDLLQRIQQIAADFANNRKQLLNGSAMPELIDGKLVFNDTEAKEQFIRIAKAFYETLVYAMIEQRELVRILMIESLKYNSKDKHLFKIATLQPDFFGGSGMEQMISNLMEFYGSKKTHFYLFFHSLVPVFSFAAFYDKFRAIYASGDEEMVKKFLLVNDLQLRSFIEWNSRIADQES